MSSQTKSVEKRLTPYESEQIEQIARWKSTPPNPFSELFKQITMLGADFVEKLTPDKWVVTTIEKAYSVSELLAGQEDIKRRAGVEQLGELRNRPLEECDRLALEVSVASLTWATVQGAATGAGGVLTTLIDIPLLFVLALGRSSGSGTVMDIRSITHMTAALFWAF